MICVINAWNHSTIGWGARMRWTTDTIRCARRFAFFPTSMYDSETNKIITIWLEPYYILQMRDTYGAYCSCWKTCRLASKEEYIEWNKKEKD